MSAAAIPLWAIISYPGIKTDSRTSRDGRVIDDRARVCQDWQQQIQAIAVDFERKEAKVLREALAKYLGQTDPGSVKGAIAELQERVASLERKLASLGRLVG